jgi:hypothetical protein
MPEGTYQRRECRSAIITPDDNKNNVRPRLEARTGTKAHDVLVNSPGDLSLNGKIICSDQVSVVV